jgi:hypothetical protein
MAGPPVLAGLGALSFGVLDDLRGSGARRGLRGHLGALARGEVTTGSVKLAGLAATGLAAALLEAGLIDGASAGKAPGARGLPGRAGNVIVNAGLIAGGANLLNLFDLRPGRAIKVAALSAGMIAAGGTLAPPVLAPGRDDAASVPERLVPGRLVPERLVPGRLAGLAAVAAPAGAALALLPEDLGERAMLGDAGANALGAALGAAAARALPGRARLCLLGGIVALTLASEKVSFTRVIAATPPLHWLDMLGRRPVPPARDSTARDSTADAVPGAQVPAPRDPLVPRHRPPGRHRRAAGEGSRARSGAWVPAFLKTRARSQR